MLSCVCLILCDPMDCSTPGLPVHYQLPEFTQTHVHWVCDAILPSHPLSSPSPPAFNLSQHQGLFQRVTSSIQVAKVLELHNQSFPWIFRTDFFRIDWLDLLAVQGTQESSPTPQFKSISSSVLSYLSWVKIYSQFSHSVMSDSLRPHGLQHARLPCPSPTSRAYSNSCPSHWWCHPTISSSVVPFYSYLQSFPASGSFPMSQFFASGGQSTGVSASASILPMNIQDWFPLGWTGWISLQYTTVWRQQFFGVRPSLWSSSHIHTWLLEKP